MIKIELSGLRFHAFHGLYPEEQLTGNEFEVNLSVYCAPVSVVIKNLSETIDYSKLYALLKEEMQRPRQLLETLVMEIAEKVHLKFAQAVSLDISIKKINLPIPAFTGSATVCFSKAWL